jgi:hypothetical protein
MTEKNPDGKWEAACNIRKIRRLPAGRAAFVLLKGHVPSNGNSTAWVYGSLVAAGDC